MLLKGIVLETSKCKSMGTTTLSQHYSLSAQETTLKPNQAQLFQQVLPSHFPSKTTQKIKNTAFDPAFQLLGIYPRHTFVYM